MLRRLVPLSRLPPAPEPRPPSAEVSPAPACARRACRRAGHDDAGAGVSPLEVHTGEAPSDPRLWGRRSGGRRGGPGGSPVLPSRASAPTKCGVGQGPPPRQEEPQGPVGKGRGSDRRRRRSHVNRLNHAQPPPEHTPRLAHTTRNQSTRGKDLSGPWPLAAIEKKVGSWDRNSGSGRRMCPVNEDDIKHRRLLEAGVRIRL